MANFMLHGQSSDSEACLWVILCGSSSFLWLPPYKDPIISQRNAGDVGKHTCSSCLFCLKSLYWLKGYTDMRESHLILKNLCLTNVTKWSTPIGVLLLFCKFFVSWISLLKLKRFFWTVSDLDKNWLSSANVWKSPHWDGHTWLLFLSHPILCCLF